MSFDLKSGRGWLSGQVNDNLTITLSEIHEAKAEVVPMSTLAGELRCVLEVGHASIIMPLSVAEAICDALRFHQMGEHGDAVEGKVALSGRLMEHYEPGIKK
jgi:hypothetical protein